VKSGRARLDEVAIRRGSEGVDKAGRKGISNVQRTNATGTARHHEWRKASWKYILINDVARQLSGREVEEKAPQNIRNGLADILGMGPLIGGSSTPRDKCFADHGGLSRRSALRIEKRRALLQNARASSVWQATVQRNGEGAEIRISGRKGGHETVDDRNNQSASR